MSCWTGCCFTIRARCRWTLRCDAVGCAGWLPQREQLLAHFDRYAWLLPEPPPAPLRLRCVDPDDQVFVDLALANSAHWLLSHDKAVLRLRRRMPAGGPRISRLDDWPGP